MVRDIGFSKLIHEQASAHALPVDQGRPLQSFGHRCRGGRSRGSVHTPHQSTLVIVRDSRRLPGC